MVLVESNLKYPSFPLNTTPRYSPLTPSRAMTLQVPYSLLPVCTLRKINLIGILLSVSYACECEMTQVELVIRPMWRTCPDGTKWPWIFSWTRGKCFANGGLYDGVVVSGSAPLSSSLSSWISVVVVVVVVGVLEDMKWNHTFERWGRVWGENSLDIVSTWHKNVQIRGSTSVFVHTEKRELGNQLALDRGKGW